MKTISIKDIEGIRIGNAQNFTGGTGCTAVSYTHLTLPTKA